MSFYDCPMCYDVYSLLIVSLDMQIMFNFRQTNIKVLEKLQMKIANGRSKERHHGYLILDSSRQWYTTVGCLERYLILAFCSCITLTIWTMEGLSSTSTTTTGHWLSETQPGRRKIGLKNWIKIVFIINGQLS